MKRAVAAGRTRPSTRSWALPHDPASASQARKLTDGAITEWGIDPAGDFAFGLLVCVSEAVTNAVTHGEGHVQLTVEHTGDAIACQVRDGGRWRPRTSDDPEHGRGLKVIIGYAEVFAVTPDDDGKTVAFRIPLSPLAQAGVAA